MGFRSVPPILGAFLLGLASSPGAATAADAPTAARPDPVSYKDHVVPLLSKYCYQCHGERRPKADLNLSGFADELSILKRRQTWELVVDLVEGGDMPPHERPQPTAEERELLTAWVRGTLDDVDCGGENDPGRVTLRRLNRTEYNNTIRDLVGVDFRPADDFPSDDVGYGFDNIGDVLALPPILMEQYMAAAEAIVAKAIIAEDDYRGASKNWEPKELIGGEMGDPARHLNANGEVSTEFAFPKDGVYLLRSYAFGQQAGDESVKMAFLVDGQTARVVDVTAVEQAPALYETRVRVEAGRRRLGLAFTNDFYQPDAPDPRRRDRNLRVLGLEVQGPIELPAGPLPESHRRILFRTPTGDDWRVCAQEILQKFADRAYRRPATPAEIDRLVQFADMARQNGDSFERGIQLAMQAVLVSPHFLFRVEYFRRPRNGGPIQPISDFELASRLSYFLWSSMPDDELSQLAGKRQLRTDGNLESQVRRMLADPKASALVENFADQWLQIRNLKTISPDPGRFPDFDEALRSAMQEETELFFEAIMREDRSILEFLDAEYTFVNDRLARHYGIEGVEGGQFRRLALEGGRRGGILTQASVLTATSNPTRTSPVKRGKWILEQVLGTPPSPPPPDVPELEDDQAAILSGSLRERMEKHRSNASCATCHNRMDPLGFGFENYDAVGAWREKDGTFPIDPSGVLPSGESFRGPQELKALLKGRGDEFARCLTEKMLTYALGRGLEYYDKCAADRIVETLSQDGYKFSRLVTAIVESDPFQKRKRKGTEK